MYTFQAGNVTLNFTTTLDKKKSLISSRSDPHCSKCPVGAKCNGDIKPLANYWSYRSKDKVFILRCPSGYCCQDDESCQTLHSCNSNRSGTLCGVCEKNLAESLFDETCVPSEKCNTWLIILLYLTCVIAYCFGLMMLGHMKTAIIFSLKKIYICIERICPMMIKIQKKKEKSEVSKKDTKERSLKYLPIIFYYVQDVTLFKIELPGKELKQANIFVKILQFTPDVITSFIETVSDICFGLGKTAVSKIVFKSIFGPCTMAFLLVLYLCQACLSLFKGKKSRLSSVIKYKIIETFVLVVLLSYQQIVTGAFTLVKCIAIGGKNIMFVQGNIQCFTQW